MGALNLRAMWRVASLISWGVAVATATLYMESYELSRQLQGAMESRAVIEQAKGILMAAQRCTPDAAFKIRVRASQNQNRKLRAIA